MEIGQECAYDAEIKSGRDEDVSLGGVSSEGFRSNSLRRSLEGAHYGCAHGYDSTFLAAGAIHGVGGFSGDGVVLPMEPHGYDLVSRRC